MKTQFDGPIKSYPIAFLLMLCCLFVRFDLIHCSEIMDIGQAQLDLVGILLLAGLIRRLETDRNPGCRWWMVVDYAS